MRLTRQPAFYARTGSLPGDLLSMLHLPYTLWHLAYVVIGAAAFEDLDWIRLGGTMLAFFAGTGIGAHALDELNGRPLGTGLSDGALWALAALGFLIAVVVTVAGVWVISPWVVAWAVAGVLLAVAYPLEWWGGLVHTDLGYALSWGAFPVLVGAWAQAETLSVQVVILAVAITLLSLVQRALSRPARHIRRRTRGVTLTLHGTGEDEQWSRDDLLDTWEQPLRLLSWFTVILALFLALMQL